MSEVAVAVTRLPGNDDIELPRYETAQSAGLDLAAAVAAAVVLAPGGAGDDPDRARDRAARRATRRRSARARGSRRETASRF